MPEVNPLGYIVDCKKILNVGFASEMTLERFFEVKV